MIKELESRLSLITPLDEAAMEEARLRWSQVAKPLFSLGILEKAVVKAAGIQKNARVDFKKKALAIFCADNGIVKEGVTQTGQEVTAIVAENMTNGKSSVCLMADRAGMEVFPVDIGIAREVKSGLLHPMRYHKIAWGTRNFNKEPAMTRKEALLAIEAGIELAGELAGRGYGLIATGEMGIGNTTTSSAVSSLLLQRPPEELTGRGAGLNDRGLSRKLAVIKTAIERYGPECRDAVDVLAAVGGFDLAGLAGMFLGGAIYRLPVLVDGFISAAAALTAERIYPGCRDFMLATHVSGEPAGRLLLDELGLEPFIQAGMCLGEGSGAVAAVPLLEMALDIYTKMSSFDEIHVEAYKPMGGKAW